MKKPKPNKPVQMTPPAFLYASVCCNELGEKTPCVRPKDKKEALTNSLGSWRCSRCKKPCKVNRSKLTQKTGENQ